MTTLVVLTVVELVLLIAGLAAYLWIVGTQLEKVAGTLEDCNDHLAAIEQNAAVSTPRLSSVLSVGARKWRRCAIR